MKAFRGGETPQSLVTPPLPTPPHHRGPTPTFFPPLLPLPPPPLSNPLILKSNSLSQPQPHPSFSPPVSQLEIEGWSRHHFVTSFSLGGFKHISTNEGAFRNPGIPTSRRRETMGWLCCLPAAISPPQAPEPIFLTRHSFYELSLLTVLLGVLGSSLIALTWPTDSAVPHQSNHDTAYLLQSPSNSLPDCFLRQWYCILLAAQFSYLCDPSAIDRQRFQPTCLLLPSPFLPALFSVQPELPTSTPDLHSSSLIALTWPTDSAAPHQSNHDTAYLLQSPSNKPPDYFLHQWYCIVLLHRIAAQFSYLVLSCDPSAIDRQSFQPTFLLLPSPFLPALFSVQPELPTSTPDLHSLQTCLSLRTINHLNILSHCLCLGPV
ncbi:hypothetical protein F7725_007485 [Dissostichus mawsoni]|uniref:Uncharacterized protein n=1 Tax=Dissostichus mawsoni TaxID=36200 RepID=A0A7J5Y4J5_DISMA|nr:hypothetical protein F7725_007485 [Dissostichus mawsoni]